MPYAESHLLKFRWEVFNALNHTEFDVSIDHERRLTKPARLERSAACSQIRRVMQFALRYEF